MTELQRSAFCFFSIGLSCFVFWSIWGEKLPASGVLHKHYPLFVAILLSLFMIFMALTLRSKFEKGAWPLLVGTLVGYGAASLAYLIYLALFERENFAILLEQVSVADLIMFLFSLPPLSTLSWFFGLLSGAFFILSRCLLLSSKRARQVAAHKN